MYGFLVHGCIDGGSNFCVYATLALNKRGSTLRDAFDKAVDEYGYPLRMRAGMCFEATFVGQRMLDERSEGSIITGPSTANQVSAMVRGHCASNLLHTFLWSPFFITIPVSIHCLALIIHARVRAASRKVLELYLVTLCVVLQGPFPEHGKSRHP